MNWLIALREEPENAELCNAFDAWLLRSDENTAAWQETQKVWQLLGDIPQAATRQTNAAPARLHARFGRRGIIAAGAGIVAFACFMVLFLPALMIWLEADYRTAVAEIREIHLDDGSVVLLGADSALSINLGLGKRSVRLLTGEAYFEVMPDPTRPFEVAASDVTTTVLGTGFDVRLSSESVSVAVAHGRVRVTAPTNAEPLAEPLVAGDWVRVDADGGVERGVDPPELVASWRSGMLVVRDQPVGDVVDEIRRHLKGKVILADPGLSNKRVTGVYDLKRPLDALSAVVEVHGSRLRKAGPWLAIASPY